MAHHGKVYDADMPLVLALETTGMCGSVALVGDGFCVGELSLLTKVTHSRRLLNAIETLFEQAGCDWDGVSGIAVSLGPGSFTGIRIALSTAKGLAMAAGKPLVGISTLDGIAGQFTHLDKPLCVILDARKKEVYAAFYECLADGTVKQTSDYMVLPPEQLAAQITEPTVMAGDGAEFYADLFLNLLGDKALLVNTACHF
ncbi:MAG: tRNA (adenosine(37)-N6)-threonylcarbamoyltransferase complex dimerization subunit type 1 TsaB, partial [Desulfobulbaceae bacterium]|nr:tRNA (adenosine(37)-N6)-threonylcarbamoyltransferase complex dimerization subunit type 1 TsaB [Desulfobulbaceae bacterium]